MALLQVLSNFLLLASTTEYLDLVLNSTAIVFIIELDDAALNADAEAITDLYRAVCYKSPPPLPPDRGDGWDLEMPGPGPWTGASCQDGAGDHPAEGRALLECPAAARGAAAHQPRELRLRLAATGALRPLGRTAVGALHLQQQSGGFPPNQRIA